jgi:hypothetical protein
MLNMLWKIKSNKQTFSTFQAFAVGTLLFELIRVGIPVRNEDRREAAGGEGGRRRRWVGVKMTF